MDAYKGTTRLLAYHQQKSDLQLYPYTPIVDYKATRTGYDLYAENGKIITCKHLVIASGYEAGKFLPRKVMNLLSTYALVTEPVPSSHIWPEAALLWETARPYFYLRTTRDNRIIMGGEDIRFKNERLRDALLERNTGKLLQTFKKLFPAIPVKCETAWCGTFSATEDGLPYIGLYPGQKNMYFALGYGGNGITFSMIAAQVIRNKLMGKKDNREAVFGFERK